MLAQSLVIEATELFKPVLFLEQPTGKTGKTSDSRHLGQLYRTVVLV
jgi:hypothetical protein